MKSNALQNPSTQLVFSNDIIEVWKEDVNDHHALYAIHEYEPGAVICEFKASAIVKTPSYLTIQKNEDEHICLDPLFLQYTNHSCSPNIFFDTTNGKVVCLQPIKSGTELTYFYPSTEWEMAEPFQCHCGSKHCLHEIRGAAYLSPGVLSGYRLSDFIREQIRARGLF